MRYHQAIVVGGGLAGLRATVALLERGVEVALFSKVHPLRSHSVAAQGGINAALGNHPEGRDDSWERHAFDTVKGSDYLADQDAVVLMCREAPARIEEMNRWGCPFSRFDDGRIAQRPFGGAGFPRTAYAADKTGLALLTTLYEQLLRLRQIPLRAGLLTVYEEWIVTVLAAEEGTCCGLVALDIRGGEMEAFQAEAVLFATGGAGRLYAHSTNAVINTGEGLAVAYWAGAALKDMEFIQFHPTTLYGTNVLISEAARGEGGVLLNSRGERFLAHYETSRRAMEIAPRDIVARNLQTEILEGRGFEGGYVHLDLRRLGADLIKDRLPGIRELALNFAGIDPIDEPLPVQPGQHYTMGGIACNVRGETALRGLYAAGEAACISVHGANRLGGNSLLDTLVFGAAAGEQMAAYIRGKTPHPDVTSGRVVADLLREEAQWVDRLATSSGKEDPTPIREELKETMIARVGIFRSAPELQAALTKIKELQERYRLIRVRYRGRKLNYELVGALELKGKLDLAEVIVQGALAREESRGSHFRADFPHRDDAQWLKHTLAVCTPDGPQLRDQPVTLGYWTPEKREY
ncbi:MAG: FAD-binding protein [Nitrospirae bacterium]|nr:FAD-binding protein [Nitrospirota bacterium]